MPLFCYSPNDVPPAPPAYIQAAAPAAEAAKAEPPDFSPSISQEFKIIYLNQLPDQLDNLPYDHAFPYGVDPNDPSKPYAPYGFYCDENGKDTAVPDVGNEKWILQNQLSQFPDPNNPASPLNVYNIESPMDPYNMQQFFYAGKPGSPWYQYERQPDQEVPWEKVKEKVIGGKFVHWLPKELPGYLKYPDQPDFSFKDTPENFPWLHDQDPSHHYRKNSNGSAMVQLDTWFGLFGPDKHHPPITEKIFLDSPTAPAGWHAVESDGAGNNAVQ